MFGDTAWVAGRLRTHMPDTLDIEDLLDGTDAPTDRTYERLDARELPPPEPLTTTLELLGSFEEHEGLVQVNDRAPQHLYPKLDDRDWAYETVETETAVVTAIWRP